MRNPGLKKRLLERLDIIGLLAFSIVALFITFPNLLFSANIEDIPNAVIYYRYFFAAAFIILLVLTFIFLFLRRRIALILASLLGAYALLVIIFDIVYPLRIGLIIEGTEMEPAAPVAGAIQIVLGVVAFFVLFYIPRKVRAVLAWSLSAVLLVSGLPFMFAPSNVENIPSPPISEEGEPHPDFNIYDLVFDQYYGPWVEWSLLELSENTSKLAGFTHYQRNVANYFNTRASYPSFTSGTLWSPNMTISEWYDSVDESSIVDDLHERGFSTAFYGLRQYAGMRQVQEAYTADPGAVGIVDIRLAADYWLLRVAPVAMRHLVLDYRGAGPITRYVGNSEEGPSGDIRPLVSYRQFQKFLDDERLRPSGDHYVHAYFVLPHPPHQLDRHGNYVGESSYDEQLLLATNMLLELVETLKELERFESSLIIIHSDTGDTHGALECYAGDPLRDFILIDETTSEAISEGNVRGLTGVRFESAELALLLIKPPGAGTEAGTLTINHGLTQLLDLREYIKRGIDEEDWSHAYPEREKVDVYHGLVCQLRDGTVVSVGRDITSGYINHYIIRPGGEWEIGNNIPFQYK